MKYKIKENQAGQRLDKFLSEKMPKFSRAQIQKRIKNNLITVNDKKVIPHYSVKNGDIIKVSSVRVSSVKKNVTQAFRPDIIKETDDYLIINKPAGLLVHADAVHDEKTVVDWLIEKHPKVKRVYDKQNKTGKIRPGIVHRLDRDVSGLLVVAKTQKMFNALKKQFKDRKIKKEYLALAHGMVEPDEGEILRPISRSKKTGLMIAKTQDDQQSKNAVTKFEVLERFKNYTLLKIKLITGRTHQIRVHLKSIGHSVVGDSLYKTRDVKMRKKKDELTRLFLCATKLGFKDLNKEWQEFEIKLPKELKDFLKDIRI